MSLTGPQSVVRGGAGYPARLLAFGRPPQVLWYLGGLPRPDGRAIAIVGSRAASGRGRDRARSLAAGLARGGWAVVSGGAFGIDAAAHEGALEAGGETYAVLGCGVDVVYPDRHVALFGRIAGQGGLLSQHPPGTQPRAQQFPSRNRIIAALSDAVLVVEAAFRSGALITAQVAVANGQRLLAVPGTPGTDDLIVTGRARPVGSVEEIERAIAHAAPAGAVTPPDRFATLITALGTSSDTPGGLARKLGLPLSSVMGLLLEAELEGWVRRAGGSHYEVPRAD